MVAERLASSGANCIVIDKRPHVGGNAYDELDRHGVLVHRYGPHIFHTKSERIFRYLSLFTEWRPYEHRVLSSVNGKLYPFPINRKTLELVYERSLTEEAAEALIEQIREPQTAIENSEQLVLNSVGRRLYEMFFYGYTLKQWGRPPSSLSSGVAARIPVRYNDDDRYFADEFQAMPAQGYTAMFNRMLDHPNIQLHLNAAFDEWKNRINGMHVVYTGPIDAFFAHKLGRLPYRSLSFEHEHIAQQDRYQPVGTVNYPNDFDHTRVTEFKHLTGQNVRGTSIVREYPQSEGEPYYPIPAPENEALYQRYRDLAAATRDVTFIGRLAQYRYYNMDQVVGAALTVAERLGARPVGTGADEPA